MADAWGGSWSTSWASSWTPSGPSSSATCVDAWGGSWADSWDESWCVSGIVVTDPGGSFGNWAKKKKKPTVIRYSDFTSQEAYAAALAKAVIPMSQITEDGGIEGDSEIDDDDAIIQALFLIMKIH